MNKFIIVLSAILLAATDNASAFQFSPRKKKTAAPAKPSSGYVPSGMTPEQYSKLKQAEKNKYAGKNLGALGPQTFVSRSMQSFQEAMDQGKAGHLLPVFFAKDKLEKKEISKKDIPVS